MVNQVLVAAEPSARYWSDRRQHRPEATYYLALPWSGTWTQIINAAAAPYIGGHENGSHNGAVTEPFAEHIAHRGRAAPATNSLPTKGAHTVTETLADNDLTLVPTTGSDDFTGFAIEVSGTRVGIVALQHLSTRLASIRWTVSNEAGDQGVALRSLRLAIEYAFTELGLTRVEAHVDVGDPGSIRNASIAGLRREGIIRGFGDDPDRVLLARLADDPAPFSREGFVAILNAGLPRKRVISQGLLRDEQGRILLCQLTYKSEWDLPGGVVEVGEAPAAGLVRELQEELGITVEVKGLVTVNWLPQWRQWDDACIFLFDLGIVDSSITDGMTLQPTEIKAVEWCDPETVVAHATAATIELISAVDAGEIAPYREAPLAD